MISSPYYNICDITATDGYGYYECDDVREDCVYTICVSRAADDYCGLDLYDIDIIRNHYLGHTCLTYKWQFYAADVTNDGTISVADITAISRYLLSVSPTYFGPLWKYVSHSQYVNYSPSSCDVTVPVVNNCSDITMTYDPTIEDWYGFPTGDVNYSCTTCGFQGNPKIYTRSISDSKTLNLSYDKKDNSVIIGFEHDKPVDVWSLALLPNIRVEDITGISLENSRNDILWNIDKENNVAKNDLY